MRTGARRLLGPVVAAALLTGCGSATPPTRTSTSLGGSLTVFAAASLQRPFTSLGDTFRSQNPGVTVTFGFAGSSDLVTQITAGAPADVLATADSANMAMLVDAGQAADPVDFARNTLVIVTPPDNPAGAGGFADLARAGVSVVVCADGVPCGDATATIEEATGITLAPVSEERSVTDVLNKVTTGEADAGLVYLTDAAAAGDKVTAVPFAESGRAVNTYPIAVLTDAANPIAAAAFVELVTGPTGRAVLAAAGFAPSA